LIYTLSIQNAYAQLEAKNWYFGILKAIKFENDSIIKLYDNKMSAGRGGSCISDKNGNLLFYAEAAPANTGYIHNRNHNPLKNGNGFYYSTGADQTPIIIPMPGNPNIYYLFTLIAPRPSWPDSIKGLWYHIVDMSKDNGNGEMILKNQKICDNVTEQISATFHADKNSVWIMVREYNTNNYKAYLLKNTGLDTTPVISSAGSIINDIDWCMGQMKFSASGNKIANTLSYGGKVDICNFNNKTGKVSNGITLENLKFSSNHVTYGLEFSPNEKYLYFTLSGSPGCLFQVDVSSSNESIIRNSIDTIFVNPVDWDYYCLQIGIDRKIYIARPGYYLGCINIPNEKGKACNYDDSAIYFSTPGFVGMSLPTFLQSYFYLPDIEIEHTCLGDSTSFNLKDTSNIDSVLWKFGDWDSVIKMFPKHVYTDTGFYQTQAIIFYDNTSDTFEREIRISNYAYPNFSITDSSQCLIGNEFHFYDSSYAVDGSMTYKWDFGDSTASFNQNPTKSYAIADTFPVTLTVTSSYGCESSVSKNVFVRPMPVAEIGVNDSIQCLNENSFSFLNPSASINPLGLKTWYFGDANTSNADTATHHYISADSFEVLLIEETSFGCVDTATKAIVVHPSPVADFKIIDSIQCFNENSFQFTNFSSLPKFGTLEDLSSFNWKFGDQTFSTDTHAVKTYLLADTFGVELVAESAEGCKDSVARQIIVLESPIAEISVNDSSQCFNEQLFVISDQSTVTGDSIVGSNWIIGNDTIRNQQSAIRNNLQAGTWNIQLVTSTSHNCTDTSNKDIFVHPMPKAAFIINDASQCFNEQYFVISDQSSVIGDSLISNQWLIGSDTIRNSQSIIRNNFEPATWNLQLVTQSSHNCTDTTTQQITVHPSPITKFSYSTPCLEKEISFTDKSQLTTGSINKWKWYFSAQDSSALQNPVFTFTNFGDHAVQLIVQSDSGCLDTLSKTITIYDHAPAVALERVTVVNDQFNLLEWKAPSSPIVSGYRIQKSSDFGNFIDLKTYPKDSLSLSDFSVSPDYSIYTYHILTEDSCGHTSEASNIAQSILLELDSSESFNILSWSAYEEWQSGVERYEVQIFNAQSQSWEKLEAFPFPVAYSDSANKLSQAEYCYRIAAFRTLDDLPSHSNVVCSDTRMNLFVPNAFSPNGDGKNDVFQVKGTYLATFELKIFNRWGELLFESNSLQNSWDGTFRNKKCPMGVYYFQLKAKGLDGKKVEKAGNVSVLR
jgi:gliding motility-associated-like protein